MEGLDGGQGWRQWGWLGAGGGGGRWWCRQWCAGPLVKQRGQVLVVRTAVEDSCTPTGVVAGDLLFLDVQTYGHLLERHGMLYFALLLSTARDMHTRMHIGSTAQTSSC